MSALVEVVNKLWYGIGKDRDLANKLTEEFTALKKQKELLLEKNKALRAIINSHAQSGCKCQFCQDARQVLAESQGE